MASDLLNIFKLHVNAENKKEVIGFLKFYILQIKRLIEDPASGGVDNIVCVPAASFVDMEVALNYWPEGKTSVFCKTLYEKIKINPKKNHAKIDQDSSKQ